MNMFYETLLFRPSQLVLGVSIGGLGASIGGWWYFSSLDSEKQKQLEQRVRDVADKVRNPEDGNLAAVPFPVLTTIGWGFFVLVTSAIAWKKANLRHKYRVIDRVVNFSLTSVRDNTLTIRTILERDVSRVLMDNPRATEVLLQAAYRTTEHQPFIELPREDAWYILNAIGNSVSGLCAPGFIAAGSGLPHYSVWHRLALTFEKDPSQKTRKIRVIVVPDELLDAINTRGVTPKFEHHTHAQRWDVVRGMAKTKAITAQLKASRPWVVGDQDIAKEQQLKDEDTHLAHPAIGMMLLVEFVLPKEA